MKKTTWRPVFLALSTTTLLAACTESSGPAADPESAPAVPVTQEAGEADAPVAQLDGRVRPSHYRLELHIDPREERFSGQVAIDLEAVGTTSAFWLHGKDLAVDETWIADSSGGRIEATYEQKAASGVSLVSLSEPVGPGAFTLHVAWTAAFNTQPNALFRAERGEDAYAATQFQPIAARQVFPGFDEPVFKVPFDITLVAPTGQVAITNTPEASAEDLGDGMTRRVFETTRPLPTYLLAFAVGPYDLNDFGEIPPNDVRDRGLPLRAIAARGQGERLDYALKNTAGILAALEAYFGTPYPYRKLDLIAMPAAFGGAMENAGAITYDEYLLLMDENASLDQRRSYTAVHAHELGHMWFGDLVTPDWWTDIWLNESFATWIMYKASHEFWPEGEFDRQTMKGALGAMTNDSLAAARQIREPVTHNASIGDAFDGITYRKGGGVLAMLERYTGEEAFRDGIRLHMERNVDGTANAPEFIANVAEGSGKAEIEAAFNSYIEQPGVPLVDIRVICEGDQASLEVSQSRYAPLGSSIDSQASQWLVPLCVSYQDGGETRSECAMLREQQQTVPLEAGECPTTLHPNADGAGYYRFALEDSWWQGLIAGAKDLPPNEALVLADSLDAAFRAGSVPAATWLEGMTALVNHDTWDVVEAGLDKLEAMMDVLTRDQLPPVETALAALARPRFERLQGETGDAAELLNARLKRFLMVVARDPELRAPTAALAARQVGLEGEPDPQAVPPSERETVLSIGVQDLGEPFFDLLVEQALASEDSAFRGDAFGALARTEDPALAARLQVLMLSGRMQGYEPLYMLNRQLTRAATRDLTYEFVRQNYEAVVKLIPEAFRGGFMASGGSSFCSAEKAAEWTEFIEARAEELPGYERSLAQAVETVNLCAALREARAGDLVSALTGS